MIRPFEKKSVYCTFGLTLATVILVLGCAISAVSAADASYEGYLGDTITLQGVSYSGTQVFLFMTGPGLPENGVTLTDVAQRADQGNFTILDLDSNQHYSFKWNTQRIHNEIDPGTYTVYVVNEAVDKAHLGSTSSYQTLSVYLKDSGESQVSVGTAYTLNPESHISTIIHTQTPGTAVTTVAAQEPALPVTPQKTTVKFSPSATRAESSFLTPVLACFGILGVIMLNKKR
jgi:hypothetical protein